MKKKINIINTLLFIVTFFFGCLFIANLVHFITTTVDDDVELPWNTNHDIHIERSIQERQTSHSRQLRSGKKSKIKGRGTDTRNMGRGIQYEDSTNRLSSALLGSPHRIKFVDAENIGPKYDTSSAHFSNHPQFKVVHLDLKGAPPKLSYLRELFPLIYKAGGNALLVEYEDMFPYTGSIVNASALNAFSRNQIKELISIAAENNLEIIPLVQTFGHMEHVLKLEEFGHLREVQAYPQSICPSNDNSFQIISTMIDQIMELHTNSRFIHIGCDEVFQLGVCSLCRDKMVKMHLANPRSENESKDRSDPLKTHQHNYNQGPASNSITSLSLTHRLYLEHVKRVASYVSQISNGKVKSIIWDDMLRAISFEELLESNIANYVEPMVWVYVEDIDHFVDGNTWKKYSNLFPHIWAASAFKGAFGERLFIPNVLRHYHNHIAWLNVIKRESSPQTSHGKPINFRGIAMTGWSRYDHFAVLCELLPVAIPSLVLNLIAISSPLHFNESTKFNAAEKLLKCPKGSTSELALIASQQISPMVHQDNSISESNLQNDPHQFELRRCKFPGSQIYGAVGSLAHYKSEVEALDTTSRETQGWLTPYNVRHNYSSPWRLSETIGGHTYLIQALEDYRNRTSHYLSSVFEKSTVEEWTEQNISPLQEKTQKLLGLVERLKARHFWPRRPIP